MKKIILLYMIFTSILFSKTLVFGVVPQQSPHKLYKAWKPFIDYLSKDIGVKIIFKTEKSISKFEKNFYSGTYDIAYSNPYHYVLAHKLQNYNAIMRFNKKIVGILVVNKDSNIKLFSDIKNEDFLFPAPKAFGATILTKYDVMNKLSFDIDKSKKIRYVNSHDSVYLGIQRGIGKVGGGIIRTFNRFKYKEQLKIIYKTDQYPSHPISISNKISKKLLNKIKNSLLSIPVKFIKPINKKQLIKTNNEEHDIVKQLAIKLKII
jgi:phosphonate transport system substrate-binding protein